MHQPLHLAQTVLIKRKNPQQFDPACGGGHAASDQGQPHQQQAGRFQARPRLRRSPAVRCKSRCGQEGQDCESAAPQGECRALQTVLCRHVERAQKVPQKKRDRHNKDKRHTNAEFRILRQPARIRGHGIR